MKSIQEQLEETQDRREVLAKLSDLAPDFVSMISSFCLGEVYARPALNEHLKETIAIVSLVSLGTERLTGHFESALDKGMSKDMLVEIVTLSSIYLGFPRAIDAMIKLHQVLEGREESAE